jgi:hypothetical protein
MGKLFSNKYVITYAIIAVILNIIAVSLLLTRRPSSLSQIKSPVSSDESSSSAGVDISQPQIRISLPAAYSVVSSPMIIRGQLTPIGDAADQVQITLKTNDDTISTYSAPLISANSNSKTFQAQISYQPPTTDYLGLLKVHSRDVAGTIIAERQLPVKFKAGADQNNQLNFTP